MTTPSGADQARKKRQRRLHERQTAVFGLLAAFLLVVAVGATLVLTGTMAFPFDRGFTSPADDSPYAKVKAPCVPADTLPVLAGTVKVTVLNDSERKGLAGAVAQELANRGFGNVQAGNVSLGAGAADGETQIRFGVNGLAAAYTVAAHFESPVMLLDRREDDTVSVVVGDEFDAMVPVDKVGLDAAIPLQSPKKCEAADKIEALPPLPAPSPSPTADQPAAG